MACSLMNFAGFDTIKMDNSGKKRWKWILGIILGLVMIGITVWYFVKRDLSKSNSVVERSVSEKFQEMITEASDSLYRVSYTKFDLNLDSGKGVISDFKLVADSAVLQRLIKAGRAPNNVLHFSSKNIVLSNFGFEETDRGEKFNIKRIMIQNPSLTIVNKVQDYNNIEKNEKPGKLLKLMQTMLKASNIESLSLSNMDFEFVNNNTENQKRTAIRKLNIDMTGVSGLEIDQSGKKSTVIRVNKYRLATPDSLYYLTVSNLNFLPQSAEAAIKKIELSSRLNKTKFFETVKWAKDRFYFLYENLSIKNIDINRFLRKQQIHIESMTVENATGEIYTNYNWPKRRPPVRKIVTPSRQLQTLAFDMTIDTMRIENADTYYRVLAKKSDKVSSLIIKNTKGTIVNITNNIEAKEKNQYTTASMSSLLMGAGSMKLDIKFNLADSNGAYTYTAKLGKIDATLLNTFAEPFSLMSVKSGTINKMDMNVSADDFTATGQLNLYYKDMKVALLKKDKQTQELKGRTIISAISNAVLPNDNPSKKGKFKDGPINVSRDPNMSFFGFMSKCMIDGMSSSMTGLEQKKKKENSSIITKVGQAIIGEPGRKN